MSFDTQNVKYTESALVNMYNELKTCALFYKWINFATVCILFEAESSNFSYHLKEKCKYEVFTFFHLYSFLPENSLRGLYYATAWYGLVQSLVGQG